MNEILRTTLLGLFFGTFGTTIGGILGIVIKKDSNKFLIDIPLKTAKDLISKLRNPKEVGEGKYNIPNRFLFESLRKTSKRDLGSIGTTKIIDILSNGREYLREDGKYNKDYGKKIEELYEDKNKILYQHIINSNEHFKNSQEIGLIKDNIFKEGVHASLQGTGYSNSLEKTAHGSYEEDISFVDFLIPSYKILITIPKNVLNRNYEVQVWGSDSLEINKEHPFYQNTYLDMLIQIMRKLKKILFH